MDTVAATQIDFEKGGGVIPVVTQDYVSGKLLMVAYMNREAFEETVASGHACYFSRSRNRRVFSSGSTVTRGGRSPRERPQFAAVAYVFLQPPLQAGRLARTRRIPSWTRGSRGPTVLGRIARGHPRVARLFQREPVS